MKLLLDTHTFIWAISEPERLSDKVHQLLADASVERWISAATFWEIAVKVQLGKLSLPVDRGYYLRHIEALRARYLGFELEHSLALFELPLYHRDPFDRLLIAQARCEGMPIATRDSAFSGYPVECLW